MLITIFSRLILETNDVKGPFTNVYWHWLLSVHTIFWYIYWKSCIYSAHVYGLYKFKLRILFVSLIDTLINFVTKPITVMMIRYHFRFWFYKHHRFFNWNFNAIENQFAHIRNSDILNWNFKNRRFINIMQSRQIIWLLVKYSSGALFYYAHRKKMYPNWHFLKQNNLNELFDVLTYAE